jgi:hypothetical protein
MLPRTGKIHLALTGEDASFDPDGVFGLSLALMPDTKNDFLAHGK